MKPLNRPLQCLVHLKSLLSPSVCPVCKRSANHYALPILCHRCRPKVNNNRRCLKCGRLLSLTMPYDIIGCRYCQKMSFTFNSVYCLAGYEGLWKEVVLAFKAHPDLFLMLQLAHRFSRILRNIMAVTRDTLVVTVPRRWKHQPQALVFVAKKIAFYSDCAFAQPLRFIRATKPQHQLGREKRLKNMRFSMEAKVLVKDKAIVLIDDVLTTGATLNECSRALKKAGANSVVALTLARSLTVLDK